jgi:hypothetical protein
VHHFCALNTHPTTAYNQSTHQWHQHRTPSSGEHDGIVDVAGDNFAIIDRQIIYRDAESQATAELITYVPALFLLRWW